MIALGIVAAAGGIALVRLGWGGRRAIAWVGWTLVAAALALLAAGDGAWGIAVGGVAAMAGAIAFLLWAGWRTPGRPWRERREPPSVSPPRHWRGLARRVAVFVLVVPVAATAAMALAYGAQAAGRRAGLGESDATVMLLLLFPLLWCGLMAWQMTRRGPTAMIAPPAAAAVLGVLLWAAA